jgi:MarR-like DNA-binding transcriptional regulator SgrR of sgrS sRNA
MTDRLRSELPPLSILPTAIVDATGVGHAAFRLYAALATHANQETDKAWPGVTSLAQRLNVTPRRIRAMLAELERTGWLGRQQRLGRTTLYTLHGRPKQRRRQSGT